MNPFQIGVVTIGSATPLSSFAAGKPPTLKTLTIDNSLGAGTAYLGASGMNKTTLAGVVLVIPAGQFRSIGGYVQQNDIIWTGYYVDGDNAGDLVNVTGQTVS